MATMSIENRVSVWKEWSKPVFFSGLALLFGILFSFVSVERGVWMAYWSSIGDEPNTTHFAILLCGIISSAILINYRSLMWGAATVWVSLGVVGMLMNVINVFNLGIASLITQAIGETTFYFRHKRLLKDMLEFKSVNKLQNERIEKISEKVDTWGRSVDRVEANLEAIKSNVDRLNALINNLKKRQDVLEDRLDTYESTMEMKKLIGEVSLIVSNEDVGEMRVSLEQMEALARPASRDRGVSLRN